MRRPGATGSGASTLNDAVVRDPESAVLNVLSSGSVIIVDQGHTYRVDQLENIPMQAAAGHFSAIDRRSHRLFGVDKYLRVRRIEPETLPVTGFNQDDNTRYGNR